jgi:hypothetical protein
MSNHRYLILSIPMLAVCGLAQPPIAPSPTPAGDSAGDSAKGYNVVNNFEVGDRFRTVAGSLEQYRSSVNYGNGIRLLSGSVVANSVDGHGKLFDQLVLNTSGLGNDPYQFSSVRLERNRTYRYEMSFRENAYFNPGLLTGGGASLHEMDTNYRMQDHNLTLFPQSRFKFFLGYTGSGQTGPAFISDENRPGFQFSNVRRSWNEYRVGSEFTLAGVRVNWMRGWEDFKQDDIFGLSNAGVPGFAGTSDPGLISRSKADPYHGTNPYWRVALFQDRRWFNWNGRFTYTAGQRNFLMNETLNTVAGARVSTTQIYNSGNAQRPIATGNLNFAITPNSKLSFVNSTAVYSMRTQGSGTFTQLSPGTPATSVTYNYLGIRTVANDSNVNYQWTKIVGLYAGYHYSDRLIQSNESTTGLGNFVARQTSILNSVNFGVRIRPWQPLLLQAGGEVGTANRPFTPIAPKNFQTFKGRAQYRARNLQLSTSVSTDYNNNSITVSSFASKSRRYTADGSWTPQSWISIDAGYSKMHLDTLGGIAYIVATPSPRLITGEQSLYVSNLHTIYTGIRFSYKTRAEVYAGLTRVQDVGDGRTTAVGTGQASARLAFQVAQAFPLVFVSPSARVSVKINNHVRWNAGYQYYGYNQDFQAGLGYRANTGYSSLSVSF